MFRGPLLFLALVLGGCHLVFGHAAAPLDGAAPDAGRDRGLADRRIADASSPERSRDQTLSSDRTIDPSLAAPRPIAPLSTSTSLRTQPRFRWALPAGVKGAIVEICPDRSCSAVEHSQSFVGGEGTIGKALQTGKTHFWRLRSFRDGSVGQLTSASWQLFVAPSAASTPPPSAAWGNLADLDGDGFSDLLIGEFAAKKVHLLRGSANGATAPLSLIHSVAGFGSYPSATDFNGDGVTDLAVGGDTHTLVFLLDGTWKNPTGGVQLSGGVAAGVGDVNGDGYGDLLVAAPGSDSCKGRVNLHFGSPAGPVATPARTYLGNVGSPCPGGSMLGHSVDGAGDINGDGHADFVLGTYDENAAFVCLGSPNGPPAALAACKKLPGPDPQSQFGWQVAGAGDVNGDGYADVAIGGLRYSNHLGRVYLYLGSASGAMTLKWTLTGDVAEGAFGHALSGAGDVDGDGHADLVVGACAYLLATNGKLGDKVYFYRGGSGPAPLPQTLVSSVASTQNIELGRSVAGIGDLDGDGLSEFAVSSAVKGEVYIFGWGGVAPTMKWKVHGQPGSFGLNLGRTH